MIKNLNAKLNRFAPKALPILHVHSFWRACFNAVAAFAIYRYIDQSDSLILVGFGVFIVWGLSLPVVYYLFDAVVRFDVWLVRKSRGENDDKSKTRWRGKDNSKRK